MAVRSFFALSGSEKIVVLEATILLLLVRAGLVFFSLSRMLAGLQKLGSLTKIPFLARGRVLELVEKSSRHLPVKVTCLSLALVAQTILTQSGRAGVLRIGVKRMSPGWIEAHAWLEEEGRVVLGGPQQLIGDYTPILKWDGA